MTSTTMGYSVVNVDELEPGGPGGAVRFVRRALGIAVGIDRFEVPPGQAGRGHDEARSGRVEVSVVVAGSGHRQVDGEQVAVRRG